MKADKEPEPGSAVPAAGAKQHGHCRALAQVGTLIVHPKLCPQCHQDEGGPWVRGDSCGLSAEGCSPYLLA